MLAWSIVKLTGKPDVAGVKIAMAPNSIRPELANIKRDFISVARRAAGVSSKYAQTGSSRRGDFGEWHYVKNRSPKRQPIRERNKLKASSGSNSFLFQFVVFFRNHAPTTIIRAREKNLQQKNEECQGRTDADVEILCGQICPVGTSANSPPIHRRADADSEILCGRSIRQQPAHLWAGKRRKYTPSAAIGGRGWAGTRE